MRDEPHLAPVGEGLPTVARRRGREATALTPRAGRGWEASRRRLGGALAGTSTVRSVRTSECVKGESSRTYEGAIDASGGRTAAGCARAVGDLERKAVSVERCLRKLFVVRSDEGGLDLRRPARRRLSAAWPEARREWRPGREAALSTESSSHFAGSVMASLWCAEAGALAWS